METISRFIDYDCSSVSLNQHFIQQIRPTPWLNWDLSGGILWASEGLFYHFLGYIHVIKYQFIYLFLIFLMTQLKRTLLCLYFPLWGLIQRWTGQNQWKYPLWMPNMQLSLQTERKSPSQKLSHPFFSCWDFIDFSSKKKWVDCSPHRAWIYTLLSVLNHYINEFSELIDEVPERFGPGSDPSLCHIEYLTLHKATHIW